MTASASHGTEREDFAPALIRFARGLSAGSSRPQGGGREFRLSEAITEALAVGAWPNHGADPRLVAYRVLVRRFLREAGGRGVKPPNAPPQHGRGLRAGSAAVRAHPAPENSRTLDALRSLAPTERAALLLVAVERFSYAQAAECMEMPEAQFVRALARAREAFAARLAASTGRPHLRLVE